MDCIYIAPLSKALYNLCLSYLLTKLLAYVLVAHPSLVQVNNCVPDVLILCNQQGIKLLLLPLYLIFFY